MLKSSLKAEGLEEEKKGAGEVTSHVSHLLYGPL